MSDHVRYMLFELARTAILTKMSERSQQLAQARASEDDVRIAELKSQQAQLWDLLHGLRADDAPGCEAVIRKYCANEVSTQALLRDLRRLKVL